MNANVETIKKNGTVLLYNKCDFKSNFFVLLLLAGTDAINENNPRVVDEARARKLAADLRRCSYYETCATYGLNIERVFQDGMPTRTRLSRLFGSVLLIFIAIAYCSRANNQNRLLPSYRSVVNRPFSFLPLKLARRSSSRGSHHFRRPLRPSRRPRRLAVRGQRRPAIITAR